MIPDADNRPPCDKRNVFLSTDVADHDEAKTTCAACAFTAWCVSERMHAAELNGRTSVEGTWAGELWVDGVLSPKGKRRQGRPRKVVVA